MTLTWKTEKRGTFTNYSTRINGARVVVLRPAVGSDFVVIYDGATMPETFSTAAAARSHVESYL